MPVLVRSLMPVVIVATMISVASGQCGRNAGSAMELQIRLSFGAGAASPAESVRTGGTGVTDDPSHHSDAAPQEHSSDFATNMRISVQLQDSYGTPIQESPPRSDGKVSFRVCSRVTYRLRITGIDIDENLIENVQPGQGDRLMNISLHRKGEKAQPLTTTATVSAQRLQVPTKAQKELDKGDTALAKGDLPNARKSFEKAIEFYPQFDQAYNNLGVVLMQSGDSKGGEQAFGKAIQMNDHFSRAYVNLAKIRLDEKKYPEARDLLQKALTGDPLNAQILFLSEEAAFYSKNLDGVTAYAAKLHAVEHRNFAVGHFLAGRALQAEGSADEAIAQYQLFLVEDPTNPNSQKAIDAISLLRFSSGVANKPQ